MCWRTFCVSDAARYLNVTERGDKVVNHCHTVGFSQHRCVVRCNLCDSGIVLVRMITMMTYRLVKIAAVLLLRSDLLVTLILVLLFV